MQRFGPSRLILLPRLHVCGISLASSRSIPRTLGVRRCALSVPVRSASTSVDGIYDVPVGGNGYISLSVVQPKPANLVSANVIINLPQGPLFHGQNVKDQTQNNGPETISSSDGSGDAISARTLADITSSTVVTINYRLGKMPFDENQLPLHARLQIHRGEKEPESLYYHYPTPVHDTLTGFDWVLENLQPARLGIIGTHIGGSLALMLALTEPRSVHAVAALEPVCDWTSLDEYCTSSSIPVSRRRKRHVPKDLVPLLEARERFFANLERYFDSFASPILFLRSPGKDTPKVFPRYQTGPEYPVPVRVVGQEDPEEELEIWDPYVLHDEIRSPKDRAPDFGSLLEDQPPARRRKALSRWPPYGLDYGAGGPPERYSRQPIERLDVTLPWVRIFTFTEQQSKESTSTSTNDLPTPPPTPSEESERQDVFEYKEPVKRRRTRNDTVLSHQATEMVDVMRRACFFGRERGFGEERVTLSHISVPSSDPSAPGVLSSSHANSEYGSKEATTLAGGWLTETFDLDIKTDSNSDSDSDSVADADRGVDNVDTDTHR
ncbi:uncharacterized protein DSM5745_00659 [Aspergillus mulundensis]|uniref:Alpha/beta hydrolase fold-3 domain-containing protein n=1 Tax=Aspergillus mulundensis TaxID=1810919 RepID=A0A3D8T454_9EURO|nr:hypothetical protein DSM5745_00659 [Aspergillus mulundensis]RDW93337.1 hypothetical protein DSM5745_00659 [Aspergillus mulundensis]